MGRSRRLCGRSGELVGKRGLRGEGAGLLEGLRSWGDLSGGADDGRVWLSEQYSHDLSAANCCVGDEDAPAFVSDSDNRDSLATSASENVNPPQQKSTPGSVRTQISNSKAAFRDVSSPFPFRRLNKPLPTTAGWSIPSCPRRVLVVGDCLPGAEGPGSQAACGRL